MKTVKQAILEKILYIGNEIPDGVAKDSRSKFVVLGSPQEFINETTINMKPVATPKSRNILKLGKALWVRGHKCNK